MTRPLSLRLVAEIVGSRAGVSWRHIAGAVQRADIVRARHLTIYIACEMTAATYSEIGRLLGGRDHTTIRAAHLKIAGRLKREAALAAEIDALQAEILATLSVHEAANAPLPLDIDPLALAARIIAIPREATTCSVDGIVAIAAALLVAHRRGAPSHQTEIETNG